MNNIYIGRYIKVVMKDGKTFYFNFSERLYNTLDSALKHDAKFFYLSNIYFAIDFIAYIEIIEKGIGEQ